MTRDEQNSRLLIRAKVSPYRLSPLPQQTATPQPQGAACRHVTTHHSILSWLHLCLTGVQYAVDSGTLAFPATTLFEAAKLGQLTTIQQLLESDPSFNLRTHIDVDNVTALHWAALNGHVDV